MRRLPVLFMFLVLFPLTLAACGGGGDKESEGTEGASIDCRADAYKGDPGLPANFLDLRRGRRSTHGLSYFGGCKSP